MASKTFGKSGKPAEMEEREGTEEEVAAVAGSVGLTREAAPPLVPYAGDREEDQPDREGPPPAVAQATRTLDALDPRSINERMLQALESMQSRTAEGGASDMMALAMLQLADAMKGIRDGQLEAARIVANMQRTTMAPENKFHHNISAFNLRGDKDFPRPLLRCDYFLPWPVKPSAAEELTREEIELLNLVEPGEHTILRSDRTKVKINVKIDRKHDSEAPSRVVFIHDTAFNNDYHALIPHDWIRQLVTSNPKTRDAARNVLTMEEEEALILARKFNDGRLAQVGESVVSVGA